MGSLTRAETATGLAARGFYVHPLMPGTKAGFCLGSWKEATNDPGRVAEWWERWPDANIGVCCGPEFGRVVCLDLDTHGDADGTEALRRWEHEHGRLPETLADLTPTGGRHLLYRVPEGADLRQYANPEAGVDIRWRGYVVVPPSTHPDGGTYEWTYSPEDWDADTEGGAATVTDLPEAVGTVAGFIEAMCPKDGQQAGGVRFQLPAAIPQGARDDTLYRYACSLRAAGGDHGSILEEVSRANRERCKPPLPEATVAQKVEQACKHQAGALQKVRPREATVGELADCMEADADFREAVRPDALTRLPWVTEPYGDISQAVPKELKANGPTEAQLFRHCCGQWGFKSTKAALGTFRAALNAYLENAPEYDRWADLLGASVPLVREGNDPGTVLESWDGGATWTETPRRYGRLAEEYLMDPGAPPTGTELEAVREVDALIHRAVLARTLWPGCEFRFLPTLYGPQAGGKSSYVEELALGCDWALCTGLADWGQEGVRSIQGCILAEVPEMPQLGQTQLRLMKDFVSRKHDRLNPKYEAVRTVSRRCVLVATTNERDFLDANDEETRRLVIDCTRKRGTPEPRADGWAREPPPGCTCRTEYRHDVLLAYAEAKAMADRLGKREFLSTLRPAALKDVATAPAQRHREDSPGYQAAWGYLAEHATHIGDRLCAATVSTWAFGIDAAQLRRRENKDLADGIRRGLDELTSLGCLRKLEGGKQYSLPSGQRVRDCWERTVKPLPPAR